MASRGLLVADVSSALARGGSALDDLPKMLHDLIETEVWREFDTKLGEHVTHDSFSVFVTTPPLKGLGASVDLVRRMVADDMDTVKLLRRALKQKPGRPKKVDNPLESNEQERGERVDYALDVLDRDEPALYRQVIAGELSAHRAMVTAGRRPERFSVRGDDMQRAARTLLTKLSQAQVGELVRYLAEGL